MSNDGKAIDGYWLRLAEIELTTLQGVVNANMTSPQEAAVINYLARAMDEIYRMGIRLGALEAQLHGLNPDGDTGDN